MKLVDMTLTQFGDMLASDAPAPGGGSAAALEGALGCTLAHMVFALTAGREKYAEHESLIKALMAEIEEIRALFMAAVDLDTEAYNGVNNVLRMPKGTGEEKTARASAMQDALKACTITPYNVMNYGLASLEIIQRAMGKFNRNAASDLGVAVLSLKASIQGAWLNVLINIGGITDGEFKSRYRGEGEAVISRAVPMADSIYETILKSL